MAERKRGRTLVFENRPGIQATGTVVGPFEKGCNLAEYFDVIKDDTLLGQKSWEKGESLLLEEAIGITLRKARVNKEDVDYLLGGDLLNQIVASNFAARGLGIPFLGLYGACSTFSEALALGAVLVDGGYGTYVLTAVSSHHDTAERQFRMPTEFAGQRPMTAQWTVTGAGAALLARGGEGPLITHATIGRIIDLGIKDANDMGAAMAPAAAHTIQQHFADTGRQPGDYDLVITGDLGRVGLPLALELMKREGLDIEGRMDDCGILIYKQEQDVHAGGSGCACSAVVFGGYLMRRLLEGELRRILLVSTGALHSPCTVQQAETIPGIAHAVAIEAPGQEGGGRR